jgi:hypothetical protein
MLLRERGRRKQKEMIDDEADEQESPCPQGVVQRKLSP